MSYLTLNLHSRILKNRFGEAVSTVANLLSCNTTCTMKFLQRKLDIPPSEIKESLMILIKYGMVDVEISMTGTLEYKVVLDKISLLLRYPRFSHMIRKQFGGDAEMVIDILQKEGRGTASNIIVSSCCKFLEIEEDALSIKYEKHIHIAKIFNHLVEGHYIERCPSADYQAKDEKDDSFNIQLNSLIDYKSIFQEIQERKSKEDGANKKKYGHPDENVHWRVNFNQFHLNLRDDLIKEYICDIVDDHLSIYVEKLLQIFYQRSDPWAQMSDVISLAEMRSHLKDEKHLEYYLETLANEGCNFIWKVGDRSGGEYRITFQPCVTRLVQIYITDLIEVQLGGVAAKVFRTILKLKRVGLEQIAKVALLDPNATFPVMLELIKGGYIEMNEFRPNNKPVQIYSINLDMLVKRLMNRTLKMMSRIMEARDKIPTKHQKALDRKARCDAVVDSLQNAGAAAEDLEKFDVAISEEEKQIVDLINDGIDKLILFQQKLDLDLFLFQMHQLYEPGTCTP